MLQCSEKVLRRWGLVVDKRFHTNGNKGCGVVVVSPVDVGVGGDLGEHVAPASGEGAGVFGLRDDLAPEVEGKGGGSAA